MSEIIDMLSLALEVAAKYHSHQTDKQDEPYILHPIRVMLKFNDENERITALLHDIVEDTDCGFDDLEMYGFSNEVIDAVEALTKNDDEDYYDYLDRIKANPLALRIKLADINDNISHLYELYAIDRATARRLDKKYSDAMRYLKR